MPCVARVWRRRRWLPPPVPASSAPDDRAGDARPGRRGRGRRRLRPARPVVRRRSARARRIRPGRGAQLVNFARISPRSGRGIPGQFSLHSAVSVIRRHGAGVNRTPAMAPPANLNASLREGFICDRLSFVTIQATVFAMLLAVAGHAAVHRHGGTAAASPDVARVAADAVFLVGAQGVGGAVISVAAFAFQVAALHVGAVREVDVLGLARVDQPFRLALRRHVSDR